MPILIGATFLLSVSGLVTSASRPSSGRRTIRVALVAVAAASLGLGVAWARPLPDVAPWAALGLIVVIFAIGPPLISTFPRVTTDRTFSSRGFAVAYAFAMLGSVMAIALAAAVWGPPSLGSPAGKSGAIVALAALILVFLPELARGTVHAGLRWAAGGAVLAVVFGAAGTLPDLVQSPEILVAAGAVLGIAGHTLRAARRAGASTTQGPLVVAYQTFPIGLRQAAIGFVLLLAIVVDWAIRRPQ